MTAPRLQPPIASNLPDPVRACIAAANSFDLAGLMATFAEDAVVNDQQHEYAGTDAIRTWAAREIVGDRVTMDVTAATVRGASIAVAASIDGAFDKTGLPDPLSLALYFSVADDRIVQFIILRNKREATRGGLVLPPPLGAYFAAKNRQDVDAMLACFADEAIVVDEAQERRGREAIHQWMEESSAKYRVSVEPFDLREQEGTMLVTGLVSGAFPGSPVKLRYAFSLAGVRIASLTIAA